MNPHLPPHDADEPDAVEIDTLLRDLFRDADEPRIMNDLARRSMELAIDPAHHAVRFVRRCVWIMNLLGVLLIGIILWNGYQNVLSTFDSTTATSTTTTTSTTSTTVSVLEIVGAAVLLFSAAGTQVAFRAPVSEPHLLPLGVA